MPQTVDVGIESLENYRSFTDDDTIDEIMRLARQLRGAKILQLNACAHGGGVSELLKSELPIMRDLGLDVDWRVISGDQGFFGVTKSFHNGLQGGAFTLDDGIKEVYLDTNAKNAEALEERYDYIIVHDPQPLAIPHFKGKNHAKWLWRCHIDTSAPNPGLWNFLRPFVEEYDAAIFTMDSFVPADLRVGNVFIVPPAIDPLSPKNVAISWDRCRQIISGLGVDLKKPLLTQVSRFDPWKDPLGVIDVYRMVKQEVPDLQLVLAGSMALDDPEAWQIYLQVLESSRGDGDIHVFTDLTGVGNLEVNAFQQLSQVVIQKSIREGFGLTVSETLWKGTPMVAGRTGGIPLQLDDGVSGFLCETTEDYAQSVSYLLRNQDEARAMGERGGKKVREKFLIPRLVSDELRCLCSL